MDDFYALLLASNQQDCVASCLVDWSCEAAFYGEASSGFSIHGSPRSRKGSLGPTKEISPQLFSYNELRGAMDGFKEELGRGSIGAVYKGAIGGNGETRQLVAVKRLEKVIEEGEREFLNEMRSIGRTV
ncbi:hypothetical protein H6P81_006758 [Aristolochia fimbriata]|uniref:Uncharacterized protein n=1 Tax=Aristolochia fimbriata TaxID=158543 RepID=A0AAV7EZ33_ARIFI|nr:hypothetical protein H6P81_006758 [Aristolochia fimbriata]